jgi:hypothetical protein
MAAKAGVAIVPTISATAIDPSFGNPGMASSLLRDFAYEAMSRRQRFGM